MENNEDWIQETENEKVYADVNLELEAAIATELIRLGKNGVRIALPDSPSNISDIRPAELSFTFPKQKEPMVGAYIIVKYTISGAVAGTKGFRDYIDMMDLYDGPTKRAYVRTGALGHLTVAMKNRRLPGINGAPKNVSTFIDANGAVGANISGFFLGANLGANDVKLVLRTLAADAVWGAGVTAFSATVWIVPIYGRSDIAPERWAARMAPANTEVELPWAETKDMFPNGASVHYFSDLNTVVPNEFSIDRRSISASQLEMLRRTAQHWADNVDLTAALNATYTLMLERDVMVKATFATAPTGVYTVVGSEETKLAATVAKVKTALTKKATARRTQATRPARSRRTRREMEMEAPRRRGEEDEDYP